MEKHDRKLCAIRSCEKCVIMELIGDNSRLKKELGEAGESVLAFRKIGRELNDAVIEAKAELTKAQRDIEAHGRMIADGVSLAHAMMCSDGYLKLLDEWSNKSPADYMETRENMGDKIKRGEGEQ